MSYTIEVRDSDTKHIVLDIAEEFDVSHEKNNDEYCVRIPKNIGSGFIKCTSFSDGVGVLEFDCLLNEPLTLEFKKGLVHPLKILFNRESTIVHHFDEIEELHEINRLESAIISSTPQHNHIFNLPANQPICILSLEINRKLFEEKIEGFIEDMNDDLMKLFRDVNGTNLFYHKDYYSLDTAKFLEEFSECELDDFMKTVYQEGKAYEILSQQLQQYIDDLNKDGERKLLRQVTLEKIEKATEIIKQELSKVDNVVALAKRVGLSQNTLQLGFKKLYKMSVNEYIRDVRIEKAKELLETTELNITEISYEIGLNSRSYFSKLFKEKYGQSPKKYHSQLRVKDK
ncbi:AraC family transcriptional regulator [Aureibaculum sp. 2210JD6-5]|uniref:helix-turn-helix transcriptional regulator n=1 Tax=Aureibaculum sp. 2210JD6-5 TaxID=3103957 RepID=UPI002AAE201A|nr:AraC family transcriptional regulator [Aureibaculum sp. 2210JD6-5]MDY7394984.1 AraC family transcriptional regulator [Aureibaculum sp. 2210JD6-5]